MLNLFAKALGYRAMAGLFTVAIAWAVTGSFSFGATVGIVEFILKLAGYMVYESFWQKAIDADTTRTV